MNRETLAAWTRHVAAGGQLEGKAAESLAACDDLHALLDAAASLRDLHHANVVTVSRKVFIPLTQLCRDVCHYCTFAHPPRRGQAAYLTAEQVLDIAKQGVRAGCDEALFTLGDKPELRYRKAAGELASLGHQSTLSYLAAMAKLVMEETGLLPHINAGVMDEADFRMLREVSVSQGIMLEASSERLSVRGNAHFGSPDKLPARRLEAIAAAGRARVPFTSGILIGIGETRAERIASLLALRDLHDVYGHIQEIIVQNFRAKPGTRMAHAAEPTLEDHQWTVAAARLIFGPTMSIQAPPNLRPDALSSLVAAGINDWGGVSPVTPDHVNPEAPWPHLAKLANECERSGKTLVPRLAVYPSYLHDHDRWIDPRAFRTARRKADGAGFAHETPWRVGVESNPFPLDAFSVAPASRSECGKIIGKAISGKRMREDEIIRLFETRGAEEKALRRAADELRREVAGDRVSYVVTRNINYTNICSYTCRFCAFSKGKTSIQLRGKPYNLDPAEISRRVAEAWARGATEVCMQGGIHPAYTGDTYLSICRTAKKAAPGIHVHAFSPLEIAQGARTLGLPFAEYLQELKEAGLGTLPGTAAEILDDEVRAVICPDKLTTQEWLNVVESAHRIGFKTTSTIMFGHVDTYRQWARHILHIRDLQERTGGFTEFVPLPFVHMEAPIYLKGNARQGPSLREAVLMHSIARLALHPFIRNIQVSWVKMGEQGAAAALAAGANDLGGTLMNESISRSAGTQHGQEMPPEKMETLIRSIGRIPFQRTTLYQPAPEQQANRSFGAIPLQPLIQSPIAFNRRIADR